MKNSQLSEALRSLSKSEFKEFGKFISSPYFNNRSEVIRFYDSIKKFHPLFNSKDLSEEKIFTGVYPGKKYSDVLMRKLVSLTINLVLDFYAIASVRENKLEYNVRMMNMLREKKLKAIFEKKAKSTEELFLKSTRSFSYYESNYKYTTILNGYLLNVNEKSMVNKLQNEIDDFIEHFLSVSLLLYIRLGEWERGFNLKFDLKFQDEVINYYSSNKNDKVTLSTLYYNMLMLLNTGAEKYFFELQRTRDIFEDKLENTDSFNVNIVLIQYCYKRVVKGDTEYRKHQFNITDLILRKKIIPEGYLDPYFFTNTVRNASNLGEFKWCENFIKNYNSRLNPGIAEEIIDYSYSMMEFAMKNYEKALKHLSKINLEISNMKMEIKNLLIVIYYELNYTEELISLIDTYKHFLHRDTNISESVKGSNSDFLKFVSELHKIKLNEKNDQALKLKMEIEKSPYSNFKDWLLEKSNEFIKS